jgi:hypothetical protein
MQYNQKQMGHQSYLLPLNTEEEKKRILDVIRQHNQFENPEDADENYDAPVGEELTEIRYVRLLKKKPKYLVEYTHAILCGNGGGRSHTFDWFADHDVKVFPFNSSCMPRFISAEITWEIIDNDGKVYKKSKKKNVAFELIDDYNWGKTEQKETTASKKDDEDFICWIIHNQRLYKEGNISQEVKNALEENENWSWDSIPTVYVEKALIKKNKENICIRRKLMDTLNKLEDTLCKLNKLEDTLCKNE